MRTAGPLPGSLGRRERLDIVSRDAQGFAAVRLTGEA